MSLLCICAFVRASTTNPGRLPFKAKREKPIPKERKELIILRIEDEDPNVADIFYDIDFHVFAVFKII